MHNTISEIQKSLNRIKDYQRGGNGSWVLDSYIEDIQNSINEYNNRELKSLDPDPFNRLT